MEARTVEAVQELIAKYDQEQISLRQDIVKIIWHMRGGLSREEAWTLSRVELIDIGLFIEERIKIVKETKMPLM